MAIFKVRRRKFGLQIKATKSQKVETIIMFRKLNFPQEQQQKSHDHSQFQLVVVNVVSLRALN